MLRLPGHAYSCIVFKILIFGYVTKNNNEMSASNEITYLTRYTGSGIVNTIVGFIVILTAMAIGFSPIVSNIAGYAVGFMLGFVLSKNFVFRSEGHFVAEGVRYLVAFIIAFLSNLLVLQMVLSYLNLHAVLCQLGAAVVYTVVMYLLTRFYVFDVR